MRGNGLVNREQEARTRAPPTHQVQGKPEKALQLLLGEAAPRTEPVALRVGQPGIRGRAGTGGCQAGGVWQVRSRPGRGLRVEATSSGPGDCGIEASGCYRGDMGFLSENPDRKALPGQDKTGFRSASMAQCDCGWAQGGEEKPALTAFRGPDMPRGIKHVSRTPARRRAEGAWPGTALRGQEASAL